jgi:abortive infection bacteriophage resistance protein
MLNQGLTKEYKTYEEQIDILKSRGLIINNPTDALAFIKRVNYYRFSAYTLTLRKNDVFYANVSFEDVCDLYYFDYDFRKIIYAYTACIEITFRNYVAYFHAGKYGALGYLDAQNSSNLLHHANFLTSLDSELRRSDDAFVHHHVKKLDSVFPFWVAVETTSFGVLSKFFKNMHKEDRAEITREHYRYAREYIENWLHCCVYIRNIAAHGGRLYNRDHKSCPVRLPKKYKDRVSKTRTFAFVYAIYNLLPTEDIKCEFLDAIDSVFRDHPFALGKHMGFCSDWKEILK